jgi:hypothetical protein
MRPGSLALMTLVGAALAGATLFAAGALFFKYVIQ